MGQRDRRTPDRCITLTARDAPRKRAVHTYTARCCVVVFEKTCATTQKSKKWGFWTQNKRKQKQKRTYSFRGHLMTPVFNTQLPKLSNSLAVSLHVPTSNIFAQKYGRSVHIHKKLCNLELCVCKMSISPQIH